jgi:hypothetical protein
VKYQTEKTKLCKSAQKKLQSLRPIFLPSMHMNLLSHEEKDALNYFRGTGFYAYYQNPKVKPNILDTGRSFLVKMQNFEMRNKFLKTYRQRHKK